MQDTSLSFFGTTRTSDRGLGPFGAQYFRKYMGQPEKAKNSTGY